jgi:hypothetical protein
VRGDELWLDVSARDALGFAVMARVRTERPVPSPAAPLTPPVVREANHAERNDAAAISEMMPEVYEDLRRLAENGPLILFSGPHSCMRLSCA